MANQRALYLNGTKWADLGTDRDWRWLALLAAIAWFVCGGCSNAAGNIYISDSNVRITQHFYGYGYIYGYSRLHYREAPGSTCNDRCNRHFYEWLMGRRHW